MFFAGASGGIDDWHLACSCRRTFHAEALASPSSNPPGAVDALVQGALIDLFDAYGVPLRDVARTSRQAFKLQELTASIGFTRDAEVSDARRSGQLTLSMPAAAVALMNTQVMGALGCEDWARELANQLMGRIKNRLLQLGATVQIGLPVICSSTENLTPCSSSRQVYTGSAPSGTIFVTVDGMPEESQLSPTSLEGIALEGDAIFF
jgi:hypothetical protein